MTKRSSYFCLGILVFFFLGATLAIKIVSWCSPSSLLYSTTAPGSTNKQNINLTLPGDTTTTTTPDTTVPTSNATATTATIPSAIIIQSKEAKRSTPPKRLDLRGVVMLHLGKAGGGSIQIRLKDAWGWKPRTRLKWCHPWPCPFADSKAALITIRDPIDRFVSAFYWRCLVLCGPNDKRRVGPAWKDPVNFCVTSLEEHGRLHEKYHANVNEIAEALCSTDAATADKARRHIRMIGHAQYSIKDWLGDDWKRTMLRAIVNERNFDLDTQVDAAMHWVLHALGRNDTEVAQATQEQHRTSAQKKGQDLARVSSHSSSSFGNKIPLSDAGTQCLAHYYAQDYQLIGELRQFACQGLLSEKCQEALQSILDRRRAMISRASHAYPS